MAGEFLAIFSTIFTAVHGLPGGAPSLACSSMTPYHFAFTAQPLSDCPFVVRQSKIRYRRGNDTVVVTLTAQRETNRTFKGYLVRAINPENNRPIGRFREDSQVASRDRCHAGTQKNAEKKHFVVVHWSAEDVDETSPFVTFEATFVETFRKFYVAVPSTFRGKDAKKAAEQMRRDEILLEGDEGTTDDVTVINKKETHVSYWF